MNPLTASTTTCTGPHCEFQLHRLPDGLYTIQSAHGDGGVGVFEDGR